MGERLSGKVVVVTGSTRGIGAGIAKRASHEGAVVVVSGRNTQEGCKTIHELKLAGGDCMFVETDVTKVSDCKRLIEGTIERFGRLDGLVNNAGVFPRGSMLDTEEESYDHVFAVNVKGAFFCTQFALKAMMRFDGGSIVNIGSTHGFGGSYNLAAYSCSKGALHSLTRHIARNYGFQKIRANWVTVGWVATPGEYERGMTAELLREMGKQHIPIGELQSVNDIANGVVYLLSDESRHVTGTDLHITGGFLPLRGPENG